MLQTIATKNCYKQLLQNIATKNCYENLLQTIATKNCYKNCYKKLNEKRNRNKLNFIGTKITQKLKNSKKA